MFLAMLELSKLERYWLSILSVRVEGFTSDYVWAYNNRTDNMGVLSCIIHRYDSIYKELSIIIPEIEECLGEHRRSDELLGIYNEYFDKIKDTGSISHCIYEICRGELMYKLNYADTDDNSRIFPLLKDLYRRTYELLDMRRGIIKVIDNDLISSCVKRHDFLGEDLVYIDTEELWGYCTDIIDRPRGNLYSLDF